MAAFLSAKHIGLLLGPFIFLLTYFGVFQFMNPSADIVIGIAMWMVIWWMTEATHIAVTALLPLTLFPLLGVMDLKLVTPHYAHPMIYLFFGGFVIALALERVNLHRRIALNILKLTGTRADGIILGFMVATTLLSMWISNTASTVVMLPIATSVIQLLINDEDGYSKNDRRFALSILLGIAFAANIGGTATPIGTPPSVFVIGLLEEQYDIQISFAKWMSFGVPFCFTLMGLTYLVLVKVIYPNGLGRLEDSEQLIQTELDKLGKMSRSEVLTAVLFFLAALGWILRARLNVWFDWSLSDTSIAMIVAMLIFVVPYDFKKREFPLRWSDTSRLPWGILVLFGGGIALAAALDEAGIVDLVGGFIASKSTWSVFLMTLVLITLMLFMTELIGNLPLVTVLSPLIAGLAIPLNIPMLHILIPTTLAASCAFMLPMATPPNAIVFASGHIKVMDMAKAGIVLNVLSVLLLTGLAYFVLPLLF
jgi:sodium-dependent dicarboxylate transporter 2/3/5